MIKISVIMPVYNSERYIEMAANSVLKQDLKEIELILVNDGSKDDSGKICDTLQKRDKRVKVIHQENQGISAARNRGMREAEGEYIAFIDNDDTYQTGMLKKIYEYAETNSAEVVKYGYRVIEDWNVDENSARVRGFATTKKVELQDIEKDYQSLKDDGFFNMIWNGVYKRELLINNNLFFPEDVKKGYEDWIFNFRLFYLTGSIYVWKGIEYNHYQREAHSTSSSYHENQQMALIMAAKEEYKLVQHLNQKYTTKIDWSKYAMNYFIEAILMFERKNCDVATSEKLNYLKQFDKMEEFTMIKSKSSREKYPFTKRCISILLEKEKYRLLLRVSHLYNYYIVYKRKKNR